MKKNLKTSILFCLSCVLLLFIMNMDTHAASAWSTAKDASKLEDGTVQLTGNEKYKTGGYVKTVPIDTRDGFTVTFDYHYGPKSSSDYYYNSMGFQLVFADHPITIDNETDNFYLGYRDYGNNYAGNKDNVYFYGVSFYEQNEIGTSANEGTYLAGRYHRSLTTEELISQSNQWYKVKVIYDGNLLTVYRDDELVLSCSEFDPPDLSYVGFSANTAYEYMTQSIRNITVEAPEARYVKLNANGGTLDMKGVYALNNCADALPTPERDDYDFKGWYTKKSGGTKVNPAKYTFKSSQTLYARWKGVAREVKFYAYGAKLKKTSKTVYYGSKYGSLPTPTKTGYTFKGWYLNGKKITSSSKVSTPYNHTLYAEWKLKKYTVNFNAKKGTVSKESKKVTHGDAVGTLPIPTRKGYAFAGWYNAKTDKQIKSSTVIKKNVNCYAKWVSTSSKVKIKLNANGGNCSKSSIRVKYSGKVTNLPKPTRKNYKFLGWYTEKSGGTKITSATNTSKLINIGKTLYAHWERQSSSSSGGSSGGSSGSGTGNSTLDCSFCKGSGDCSRCGGDGYLYSFAMDNEKLNCYKCSHTGRCSYCNGSGKR